MTRSDPRWEVWIGKARDADLLETANRHGALLKRNGREHTGPCPHCGGKDRFSINPIKSKWHCRGHGGGGDAIGMVQHIAGLSFTEAVEDITGEPPPEGKAKPLSDAEKAARNRQRLENEARQKAREAQQQAQEEDSREYAAKIWEASKPIAGTAAEVHLLGRGIPKPPEGWPEVLRFHSSLRHPEGKEYPALIARVDDTLGQFTGIWREYLSLSGDKAPVENQKLGLGPVAGGAVRIGGMAAKIGLAEGIRTSLGAWWLVARKYPVWATLGTSGLAGVELPLTVRRAVIFSDGDKPIRWNPNKNEYEPTTPAGRKAALSCRDRLKSEGIEVVLAAEPPPKIDYENLWAEFSRETA